MNRTAGILLSVSSLPSKYGIGCFSKSAYEFADWLKEAGQSYWQILPLGPTSYGDSPYQSFSTYAGNPYFISLEDLIEEGVLTEKECEKLETESKEGTIDYKKLYEDRYPILRKAYERSNISENPDYQQFLAENEWWLSDYALFMAVKDRFEGRPWTEWAEDIRLRWCNAMDYYRRELYFDIEFQQYLQYQFYRQWNQLKTYANKTAIFLFFEDSGVTSILYKNGVYLYSTRSRIFSERGTLDFGTEIVRNISGIMQVYRESREEDPITDVYYVGCDQDDYRHLLCRLYGG